MLAARRCIRLVRLHDLLHELVTDDVAVVEVHKRNAFDVVHDVHRLDQARRLADREIDLRHVAGDDGLRAEAEARQEHLHLLGGGVLRLVEDDERVVERPAAHERDRRDLDGAALDVSRHAIDVEHVVQRIVERPQVRVDLLLQVAWQEPQLLSGLDRGTREDDAADFLREEKRHGLRHREVRLPGAGRADAEDDVVLLDGVEIFALRRRLGRDAPLAAGRQAALEEMIAQVDRVVLRDQVGRRLHIGVRQLVTVAHQRRQLADNPVDAVEGRVLAFDDQIVALRADANVEQRFEVLEVLVVGAEERLDSRFGNGDACRTCLSQFISLLHNYLAIIPPDFLAVSAAPFGVEVHFRRGSTT